MVSPPSLFLSDFWFFSNDKLEAFYVGDVEIRHEGGQGTLSAGDTLILSCGLVGADSEANINFTWSSGNGPLPPTASVGEGSFTPCLL